MTESLDLTWKKLEAIVNKIVKGISKADKMIRSLSKSKKSKNIKSVLPIHTNIGIKRKPIFLTFSAKETFNQLRQAFTKVLILWHFDPECHLWIEIENLGYVIREILSQLIFNHLTFDQAKWHHVPYFLRKMVLAEMRDKTHIGKFLIIIEVFKI